MPTAKPRSPHSISAALTGLHGAVVLFGISSLFGRWIEAGPVFIAWGRSFWAAAALALVAAALGGARPWPRAAVLGLVAGGALLAAHWVMFFLAVQVGGVAVAVLGCATAPVFTALLEPVVLRERFSPAVLGAAALTMGGTAVIAPGRLPGAAVVPGLGWGIASGLSFAFLALLNRRLVARLPGSQIVLWETAGAAALLAPVALWQGGAVSGRDWVLAATLGLFFTAVPHTLYARALRNLRAGTAAVVAALEPVYAIALASWLLGERPAARTLLGGALVLLAVAWATWAGPVAKAAIPQPKSEPPGPEGWP